MQVAGERKPRKKAEEKLKILPARNFVVKHHLSPGDYSFPRAFYPEKSWLVGMTMSANKYHCIFSRHKQCHCLCTRDVLTHLTHSKSLIGREKVT